MVVQRCVLALALSALLGALAARAEQAGGFVTLSPRTVRQAVATLNQTGSGLELLRKPLLQAGDDIVQVGFASPMKGF
jgi:hypothetical protein